MARESNLLTDLLKVKNLYSNHTQSDKNMAYLRSHDCAISLFVEDPQPLYVILKAALIFVLCNGLHHRQELFEA